MSKNKEISNCMVFLAPEKLAEKARIYAEREMVSTSAICRQALNQFLMSNTGENHKPIEDAEYPS